MDAINPATEQLIKSYPPHFPHEVERRLRQAERAFDAWRKNDIEHRAQKLLSVAAALRAQRDSLAALMTAEMGKPIVQSEQEIEKCAVTCEYFANHAPAIFAPEAIDSDAGRSYLRYDPIGAVLAIMPWNFPFWQVFRFAAPALMAGNVGILKHAPNVPGCALAIERLFTESGFPPGVFSVLLIENDGAEAVIRHPVIRAVTLTGSERAGMAVASTAGAVLKKTVLELGGSDPFIVLKDAPIESVAQAAAAARCINSGQSCIAAKRFIVEAPVAETFEAAFSVAMAQQQMGDPMNRSTQIGPLARLDLVEHLAEQVGRSVHAGARVMLGGHRLERGFYFAPSVLSDVRPGMAVFDEETFGPVAAIITAADEADMIYLANLSPFGLGASIWTNQIDRAEHLAAQLDAGQVFINGPVHSDPRLPFGGVKRSGYGRELARLGAHEFVNIKTVWIK